MHTDPKPRRRLLPQPSRRVRPADKKHPARYSGLVGIRLGVLANPLPIGPPRKNDVPCASGVTAPSVVGLKSLKCSNTLNSML